MLSLGRVLAAAACLAVAAAIVAGLALVDGPGTQRDRRLDRTRLADLERIVDALDCHWTVTGELPSDIGALLDDAERLSMEQPLPRSCWPGSVVDPQSGGAYGYLPLGARRFRLCTTFALAFDARDADHTGLRDPLRNWRHDAGDQCLDLAARTVDFPDD